MIQTRFGMHVRYVSSLDEMRGLATVIGFQGQVATYPIASMKTTNGIEELKQSHATYLRSIKLQPHSHDFATLPTPLAPALRGEGQGEGSCPTSLVTDDDARSTLVAADDDRSTVQEPTP